ncbi:MAG: HU family DNA-binding protein [Bacteroidales bacterium]
MSKIFGIWKRKFKDAEGNVVEKYYACPRTSRVVDEETLVREVSEMSSFSEPDVLGMVAALSNRIEYHLMQGENVNLKKIGVFGVWVTSEGYDDPKDINPKKVKATKVTFKAARSLTRAIKEMKFDNMRKPPKGLVTKDTSSEE